MDVDVEHQAGPSHHSNGVKAETTVASSGYADIPAVRINDLAGVEAAAWYPAVTPSHLSGTQDLLSTFGLSSVYAQHVRPYLSPSLFAATRQSTPVIDDIKGKRKATPDAEGLDAAAAGGAARSKASMKKHYSHYIVDVPGQSVIRSLHAYIQRLTIPPVSRSKSTGQGQASTRSAIRSRSS